MILYKFSFFLVFAVAVAVSAVPVQVGVIYKDVIQELGKPDGRLIIGNKQVLTYGEARVAIRDKNVISVSPEFERLLEERANKLKFVQSMREADLINYRGQWVTEAEKENILQAIQASKSDYDPLIIQ